MTCAWCSAQFDRPRRSGPLPLEPYCSRSCRAYLIKRRLGRFVPEQRDCARCGESFRAVQSNQTKCRGCQGKRVPSPLTHRTCPECGQTFASILPNKVVCGRDCQRLRLAKQAKALAWLGKEDRTCPVCATTFRYHPSLRTTYCSKDCRVAGRLGWTLEQLYQYRATKAAASQPRIASCSECGSGFRQRTPAHLTCGKPCSVRRTARLNRDANASRKPRVERTCKECEARFTPEYGDKRRVFCSAECMERSNRRGRRRSSSALRQRASWRRIRARRPAIVARYGGRCGICKRSIDMSLHWTHPLSLTIDHIHPLSAGGTDDEANLWPAHRQCNEDKSDQIGWVGWAAA